MKTGVTLRYQRTALEAQIAELGEQLRRLSIDGDDMTALSELTVLEQRQHDLRRQLGRVNARIAQRPA